MNDVLRIARLKIALQRAFLGRAILRVIESLPVAVATPTNYVEPVAVATPTNYVEPVPLAAQTDPVAAVAVASHGDYPSVSPATLKRSILRWGKIPFQKWKKIWGKNIK